MSEALPDTVMVRDAERRVRLGALLVDVRDDDEYAQSHVDGSLFLPLPELEERMGELPRDRDVLLFCRSGRRSGLAQATLRENGFERVANVEGGIIAWVEAGLPVV